MAPPLKPVRERLLQNHRREGDCWIWTGAKTRDGYGVLGIRRGHQYRAHRVSYETFVGTVPDKMLVCHTCDTPLCINPAHLFIGSPADNMQDCVRKARKPDHRGERHPSVKLTDAQVAEIRRLRANGLPLNRIARQFGVSFQHVSALYRGRVRAGYSP